MSPDITMCSPTKYKKKCSTCYRMTAKPSGRQSYSNFYSECDKYYLSHKIIAKPHLAISASDYSQRMDKIIAKGGNPADTLIALLNEANKYVIRRKKTPKLVTKRVTKRRTK